MLFYNIRDGVIRLTSDAPVYFGAALQLEPKVARSLIKDPLVLAYLDAGSLVAVGEDNRVLNAEALIKLGQSVRAELAKATKDSPQAKACSDKLALIENFVKVPEVANKKKAK